MDDYVAGVVDVVVVVVLVVLVVVVGDSSQAHAYPSLEFLHVHVYKASVTVSIPHSPRSD